MVVVDHDRSVLEVLVDLVRLGENGEEMVVVVVGGCV